MEYGYARVSTSEQNEGRQLTSLAGFGIPEESIFVDKVSGKSFDRTNYKRLIACLREGDTLVVESIDRLGRSYGEILEQWRIITKVIRADIVVQDMPLLDTRKDRDLTASLISDIVLQLLSYVAEHEREMILKRQAEGIAEAKRNGVRFGRPAKERPPDFEDVRALWARGGISCREAARRLGMSPSTFYCWAKKHGQNGQKEA